MGFPQVQGKKCSGFGTSIPDFGQSAAETQRQFELRSRDGLVAHVRVSERLISMLNRGPVLEVIACSLADAVEAQAGGAKRLEVVRDLHLGGLTPSWELVSEIKNAVDLPLRVMLRESTGFATSGPSEVEQMSKAAARFASLGVDGFVIGFLKDGEIDVELTQRILGSAPGVSATFHHAFENASGKVEALNQIKRMRQIDRVLCHGGNGPLSERVERLAAYEQLAGSEVTILAGGGIDQEALVAIARGTTIREFHVGRAVRAGFSVDGKVQAPLVSRFVQTLRNI